MSEYGSPPPDDRPNPNPPAWNQPSSDGAPPPPPPPPPYGEPPPYGQPPYGDPGQTQPNPSQPPYGQQPPPYGQPPAYGEPGYGQPPYGQPPAYGQPGYGQAPYGRPPAYGEPGYGQGGYGPPSYGAPGYGRPAIPANVRFASMGSRLGARLLDWLILSVILAVLGGIIFGILGAGGGLSSLDNADTTDDGAFSSALSGFGFLALVITVGYELVLIAIRGQTFGKQAVGIKVVKELDGQNPGGLASFLRWLIPAAGFFFCYLPGFLVYLSPAFDSSGRVQGWHDKVAKTVVIKV